MIDGLENVKSTPQTIGGVQLLSKQSVMELHMTDVGKAKKKRKKGAAKVKDILKGGS